MQFYKTIISLLLLLTYSLGFAHNLIPHCHNSESTEHIVEHDGHHHSHQHNTIEHSNSDHEHIAHKGHLDEGIYDYLVCLIHETETPESECEIEHCFTVNVNDNNLKLNKLQSTIVLFAIFQPIPKDETTQSYAGYDEIRYLSPPIEDSPHRGPPVISC